MSALEYRATEGSFLCWFRQIQTQELVDLALASEGWTAEKGNYLRFLKNLPSVAQFLHLW